MISHRAPLTVSRLVFRSLRRRPVRTGLTALGVAIGVVAIVAITTVVRGLWDSVDAAIKIDDADLVVFQAGVAADLFSVLDETKTRADLETIPEIASAVAALWHVMPVEHQPFCMMIGMRADEIDHYRDRLIRGRAPQTEDEIAIGTIVAQMLEADLDASISIAGEPHRVVGVFRSEIVLYDAAVIMLLPRLQRLAAKEGRVTAFQVRLQPGVDAGLAARRIEAAFPELVAITSAAEYHKVDQGLEAAQSIIWAVSFIAVIVGGIIVMNTMWMSVLERTRDIGVLRAIGWSRRRIVGMIIAEAAGIGMVSVLIGSPLGIGLAQLSTALPISRQFLDPTYDAAPFLLATAVAVALSVLGALLPAWRAARVSPAEALRYE